MSWKLRQKNVDDAPYLPERAQGYKQRCLRRDGENDTFDPK